MAWKKVYGYDFNFYKDGIIFNSSSDEMVIIYKEVK